MTEISKHLFDNSCRDLHCSVLLHPWDRNCFTSSIDTYKNSLIGSAKFYFIVHLVQNLLKGKKILRKKELLNAAEYYVRSTLLGTIVSGTSVSLSCFFRYLFGGKFSYYSYLFLPCTINGISILLEPPKRRGLVINLFVNLVIEYWMRFSERSGLISVTKAKQTFLFMIGSALLFYLMRLEGDKKKRTPLLWLFTPEKVKKVTNENENVCPHPGTCVKYITEGGLKYFGFGLAFTLVKVLLPRIASPRKALSSIRWRHFDLALFFGSYIGIYRVRFFLLISNHTIFTPGSFLLCNLFAQPGLTIICYLCNKKGFDSASYALPAGYFAGLSFLFKPNLGFAIASLTGAAKLFSTILYDRKIIPENIPFTVLLYCLCQGTLFHIRYMHPDVCPKYVFNLMNSVSNGRSELLYRNLREATSRAL